MVPLLRRLRTTPLDAGLATGFVAAGLLQTLIWPIAGPAVAVLYVVGSTLPLGWRRTFALEAALVSTVFWLLPLDGFPVLGFVVVLLQFFSVGASARATRPIVLVTAWAALATTIGTLRGPEPPVAAIGGVLAVVASVLVGRVVHHLSQQNAELARLTEQLREERRRAEAAAVGAERARIAQDLHDVVGHEVTLIAIHAEAAASALRVDAARAAEPVETIRSIAHRTLAEIRSVLDVLAPEDTRDDTAEGLEALAQRAQAAGIPASLEVTGTPWPATTPGWRAVHRIVRECLTNAATHAPGEPLSLGVVWSDAEVRVSAVNPTDAHRPPRPGRGLTGIRHRAELLGGHYFVGLRGGRFELEVSLPAGDLR